MGGHHPLGVNRCVGEAFLWGALGASALVVGALLAYQLALSRRLIAVVMALGTGVLIGSVSFELVDDALEHQALVWVAALILVGALVFTAGDWVLDRHGGEQRKDASGAQADGKPLAIVLGLTVLQGRVSVSLLAGIALSNLPEGMSSSSGLKVAGWPRDRVLLMWTVVVLVSALAAAAGYATLDPRSSRTGALVQAFAGGALLAMLADTLLPEAYEVEGVLTGTLVVIGFAVSLGLSAA